jgi:TolA-binding protein
MSPRSALVAVLLLAGCASAAKKEEAADATPAQLAEVRSLIGALSARLENMESQLNTMNDKVDATRSSVENMKTPQKAPPTGVAAAPSAAAGVDVEPAPAPRDPDSGFVHDRAVAAYRDATILFGARKYPESVLAFAAFLERYPDHPLAGSAQFHVGEAYYRQGELKLALREYQRVLTSYDRSPHLPDTLKQMALAEERLKKSGEAVRHRQLLLSLFPQSPAAADLPAPGAPVADAPAEAESAPAAQPATEGKAAAPTPANALDGPPPTAPVPEAAKKEPAHAE